MNYEFGAFKREMSVECIEKKGGSGHLTFCDTKTHQNIMDWLIF